MLYKRMKALCRQLALCEMQDRINHAKDRRFVYRESDFTEAEMGRVREIAAQVEDVLRRNGGRPWASVLPLVKGILPNMALGFGTQDEIIATCKYNGILFSA